MKKYTKRQQIDLKDSRQIIAPDQLREGMHIGVAVVVEQASRSLRAAQALAALLFSYGRQEGQSRLAAARHGWQHTGPQGPSFLWHGLVQNIHDGRGVWVDLKGAQSENTSHLDNTNQDYGALPAIGSPTLRYTRFESMGLAAVSADSCEFGQEAGRWLPAATVCLDQC